ncbi:hypothetical protein M8C21_033583, partial [Ambrosia artemisiifolia]
LWCGNARLCDEFPNLFQVCVRKKAKVADCYNMVDGVVNWDVAGLNGLGSDVVLQVPSQFHLVLQQQTVRGGADQWFWLENGTKSEFKVQQVWRSLGVQVQPVNTVFRWSLHKWLPLLDFSQTGHGNHLEASRYNPS